MSLLNVIETINFLDAVTVPSLIELKALTDTGTGAAKRVDGDIRIVKSPADSFAPMLYIYRAELTLDDFLPAIVQPDDLVGNWVGQNLVVLSTIKPAVAPPFRNMEWQANLSTPTRLIKYRSYSLSVPAEVTDWQPVREIIPIGEAPVFEPDYLGEIVIDTNTQNLYKAIGLTAGAGSWQSIN